MSLSAAFVRRRIERLMRPELMNPAISCLAITWALAMHIPARGLEGPDDAFYLAVGHSWLRGAPPYLNAFDVKPPGLFFLLAIAEALFGPSLETLNGLTAVCDAITAYCLWRIGRQLAIPAAGAFAAFGYPMLSLMIAANAGYPPLAAATTAAFAFATANLGLRARVGLAGLAIGFAVTIKQTAALEALALLWLLLRDPEANRRRGHVALGFVAAAAVAPVAFAFVFAAEGAFAPLFADVVVTALRRPGIESEPFSAILARFLVFQVIVWPLVTVAALAATRFRSLLPDAPSGRSEALVLWLVASWVELLAQHARWLNYLGPTFAPALLVAGAGIVGVLRVEGARRAALAGLLLATVVAAYPLRTWRFFSPEDGPAIAAAAAAIAAQKPSSHDRLLAIGAGTQLNVVTDLAPPTPYFHRLHLLCDFPGAGPERLREALGSAPRFVVLASSRISPPCLDPTAWPLVDEALSHEYRRILQAPAGAPRLDVYQRLDAFHG